MLPSLLSVTLLLASTDEKRMTLLQEKKKKGLWLGNCFPRAVDSTAETATGSLPLRGWSDITGILKIRSRRDEPLIITIVAKWKCSNVCS